jgi:hypothetical protein
MESVRSGGEIALVKKMTDGSENGGTAIQRDGFQLL